MAISETSSLCNRICIGLVIITTTRRQCYRLPYDIRQQT